MAFFSGNYHFNPLPPHGGRLSCGLSLLGRRNFNPLPPHGGRLPEEKQDLPDDSISIHSLHTEGDNTGTLQSAQHGISIHSLHTEGDSSTSCIQAKNIISIHSLHTEGDTGRKKKMKDVTIISIHSLHTEGDETHPKQSKNRAHFNPLPPHGGRLYTPVFHQTKNYFNPLPPHGGRRQFHAFFRAAKKEFQSTPSTRRETCNPRTGTEKAFWISIHSLHTEGDDAA